jgi:hypothetical protein
MGSRRKDLTEAEEAELLSTATSQAMIAARSILLSGGSQATALSTAKAAAQSILVPDTTEMDGPGLGKVFLSKRKAKRQADVVASMALLSVKQQMMSHPRGMPNYPHEGNNSFMQASVQQPPFQAPRAAGGGDTDGSSASSDDNSSHHGRNSSYEQRNFDPYIERIQRIQPKASNRSYLRPTSPQQLKQQLQKQHQQQSSNSLLSQRLPGRLPKSKVKSPGKPRDLAKGLPEEDPIYTAKDQRDQDKYLGVSDDSSSSGSETGTFGSGTVGSGTVGSDTVEPKAPPIDTLARQVGGDGFLGAVDPLLSTLTNVFFCGGASPAPYDQNLSSSRGIASKEESRQDDDDGSTSGSDEEDERVSPVPHHRGQGRYAVRGSRGARARASTGRDQFDSSPSTRGHGSHSTADSQQLLKELNLSTSDEGEHRNGPHQRDGTGSWRGGIRESMEQVVLRALSGTLQPPLSPPQTTTTTTPPSSSRGASGLLVADAGSPTDMTVSAKAKESDALSATSSLSNSNRSRMAIMAQRVKFRKWMRRRRGMKGPQDE